MPVNDGDEGFLAPVVSGVEVNMQHGILFPLGFQRADGQPLEEFLLASLYTNAVLSI